MKTIELLWGDSTQDKLYIQISGVAGTSVATVTSDPNTSDKPRVKQVIFETTAVGVDNQVSVTCSITQNAATTPPSPTDNLIIATFNDIVATFNETKSGYLNSKN